MPSSRRAWLPSCARECCGSSGREASWCGHFSPAFSQLRSHIHVVPPACLLPSPLSQLVLATYIFLFIVALESILVYHIVERHAKRQHAEVSRGGLAAATRWHVRLLHQCGQVPPLHQREQVRPLHMQRFGTHPFHSSFPPWSLCCACCPAQRRREAYRRYCKLRDQGKLAGGANPPLSAADTVARLPTVNGQGFSEDEGPAAAAGRPGSPRYDSVEEGASKPWAAANGSPPADSGAAVGGLAGAPASPPAEPFDAPASPPPPRRRFGLFGGGFFRRPTAATVRLSELCGAVSV